jgi:tetratricopeptide (TPR) repeat protein
MTACSSTPEKSSSKELFSTLDKANAAYAEGNWLEAEIYYQQLVKDVPEDAFAWNRIGNTRLQTGKVKAAIAAYQKSLEHDPKQSKPYYNLSTAYLLQAQRALEDAKNNMQSHDPGFEIVIKRMRDLKNLSSKSNRKQNFTNVSQGENPRVIKYYMPSK